MSGSTSSEGLNSEQFTSVNLAANVGSSLLALLSCDEIVPGADPSYQLCKTIYLYHPLGRKIAEVPVEIAQSQERNVSVPGGPETDLVEAFRAERTAINADKIIAAIAVIARIYGVSSLVVKTGNQDPGTPLDIDRLADVNLSFNALDPLNTAGSLTLNQNPLSPDFLKPESVAIGGVKFHPSRAVVVMNEMPVYLAWTSSAFGFVGRSVYQRALFPLKTFVQSMITDDAVTKKVALLIWKAKNPGSIANNRILGFFAWKRQQLKSGVTGNVLTIGSDDDVSSINFQNLEGPSRLSRENALKNVAMGVGMPSKLLEQETMVGGMAEGQEDAKQIARYIDGVRQWMAPLYEFFDRICQRRAWNEDFYKNVIQAKYSEFKDKPYRTALYEWINAFEATWPNLLSEPDSDKAKAAKDKLDAATALLEKLIPLLDPANKASAIEWFVNEVNAQREIFKTQLDIDFNSLGKFMEEQQAQQEEQQKLATQGASQEGPPGSGGPGGGEGEEDGQAPTKVSAPVRAAA